LFVTASSTETPITHHSPGDTVRGWPQ